MKVLVTGSSGFIGGHLCRALRAAGHDVYGVDRNEGVDLLAAGVAGTLLRTIEPDVVVHLAGSVGSVFSSPSVADHVRLNVETTVNVAQACGAERVRLMLASSVQVYGTNLYGLTKQWAEDAARRFAPDGLTLARIGNVYGPRADGEQSGQVVELFLRKALAGEAITVQAGATRSWCYIDDVVAGLVLLVDRPGTFDVGRDDDPVTAKTLAMMAGDMVGVPVVVRETVVHGAQVRPRPLDASKMRALGWEPRVNLLDGMRRVWRSL